MDAFFILLVLIALALAVLVRWDPAFWLKNYNERVRKRRG